MIELICKGCGITFIGRPRRKYCTYECSAKNRGKRYPDSYYLDDVECVRDELGHFPTFSEYQERGVHDATILTMRFGSWLDVLEKIGFDVQIPSWDISTISERDGGWLSGFFDGEGTFTISTVSDVPKRRFDLVVSISQRADNPQPLQEIIRIWDLTAANCHLRTNPKYTKKGTQYTCNPNIVLSIRRVSMIAGRIIPTFLRFPLRSKKAQELEIFKAATDVFVKRINEKRFRKAYSLEEQEFLTQCHIKLKTMRKYEHPEMLLEFDQDDRRQYHPIPFS